MIKNILIPILITQIQIHYNKLRRFIENKPEDNNELFNVLNKIERFTVAAINSKTQTIINIFLNNFLINFC